MRLLVNENIPLASVGGSYGKRPMMWFRLPSGRRASRMMGKWVKANHGFVLWIAPNESIYAQTHKALNNREHPYRQIFDRAAAGKVKILEKTTPLDRRDVESHCASCC